MGRLLAAMWERGWVLRGAVDVSVKQRDKGESMLRGRLMISAGVVGFGFFFRFVWLGGRERFTVALMGERAFMSEHQLLLRFMRVK